MNEETITITKTEYYNLKASELRLDLLDAGGVNDWEWCGEALEPEDGPSYDELVEKLYIDIFGG